MTLALIAGLFFVVLSAVFISGLLVLERDAVTAYAGPESLRRFLPVAVFLTIFTGVTASGRPLSSAVVGGIAIAGISYRAPAFIAQRRAKSRGNAILHAIPAALDLLVVALEAGQSFDAALAETTRELEPVSPELTAEFSAVQRETLAGRSRAEVFRSLAERTPEPELRRLALVFLDCDRFGTALAPALRSHVRFLRQRLRQQAYEQARKVSVKLVFPVFFLIFPAVILVTLGPAVIQIHDQLLTMLGN